MGGGNISASPEMMNPSDNATVASVCSGGETHVALPLEKTVVVDEDQSSQPLTSPPYDDMTHMMRPLFHAVHTLCCMDVIEEGIRLPTIVVIGDQSSGKSSLIRSLTGIDLPTWDCTRVPLIIKIQHHSNPDSELRLKYKKESVSINETDVYSSIRHATNHLAGRGYEISDVPMTLVVKKNSVRDTTIVDLPGIPVDDQWMKITDILGTYVKPEDCIILNVMSATADFPTCESIKISEKFDRNGKRTVHVFTKLDEASEDMVEDMVAIVTTNYTGPDYMCVRNRLSGETHEEARAKEASLFETHHLLSKIDKSMVGVHVLAQKLFMIQLDGIYNFLGKVVGFINEDLNACVVEQNRLQEQHNFTTVSEAMPAFVRIIKMSMTSLGKVLMWEEFNEFPDETQMHCCFRLREMSKEFAQQLKNTQVKEHEEVLGDEQVFHFLFQGKIANISAITNTFVSRVWDYVEVVIIKVLGMHAQNSYPQLFLSLKKAAKIVIARQKESFKGRLLELLDMKKIEGYKRDPRIISLRNESFDIKKRMVACLELVFNNLFYSVDLDLPSMVYTMVTSEMETQMVNELKSDGENRYKPMLKESPSMTTRRWKLKNRIELLDKLKKVVENAIDEISSLNF